MRKENVVHMKFKKLLLPAILLCVLLIYGCADRNCDTGANLGSNSDSNSNQSGTPPDKTEQTGGGEDESDEVKEIKAYMLVIDGQNVAYLEKAEELEALKAALISEKNESLAGKDLEVVEVTINSTLTLEEVTVKAEEISDISEVMERFYDAGGKISFSVTVNETETQYISFETVYQNSSAYTEGTKVTKTEGVRGEKQLRYEVTYTDGEESARNLVSEKTVKKPQNKVVLVGTKKSTASTGSYAWPLSSVYITSPYGGRYINSVYSNHYGLDLRAAVGTAVYAADGGKVIYAGTNGNYGKLVKIQHDNGDVTYYAHLSKIEVSVGDRVYKGQRIAKSGATGRVTGPHLHFEIRKNGKAVDPAKYLPKK